MNENRLENCFHFFLVPAQHTKEHNRHWKLKFISNFFSFKRPRNASSLSVACLGGLGSDKSQDKHSRPHIYTHQECENLPRSKFQVACQVCIQGWNERWKIGAKEKQQNKHTRRGFGVENEMNRKEIHTMCWKWFQYGFIMELEIRYNSHRLSAILGRNFGRKVGNWNSHCTAFDTFAIECNLS